MSSLYSLPAAPMAATLAPRYPAWEEFQRARETFDPGRTFSNEYTERVLGP